jgi:endonuclease/exonuclease/phosphatase family metal-dependent hydrolase
VRACDADVVVLQEAARPDVVERVARDAGMKAWASHPNHSVAFMSRIPIAHHEWHRPPPSRRAFLEIVPEGDRVRIFGVHLSAVHSNWTEQRRARELRALLTAIEKHQHGFHVVAGDFNTLSPGEQLDVQRLPYRLQAVLWLTGGRIRWQTIQIMLDAGYLDAYRMLHPGDPGFTFPTWDPHVRLDYAFVPGALADRLKGCDVMASPPGLKEASDHLPLRAEVD